MLLLILVLGCSAGAEVQDRTSASKVEEVQKKELSEEEKQQEARRLIELRRNTIKLKAFIKKEEVKTFSGHSSWVQSVAFSPDGKFLASGSYDNTIKIWNINTDEEIRTLTGHGKGINSVAFSPDGKFLASGSDDNTIKIWNINIGREIRTLAGHSNSVTSIAYSPDGKFLASACSSSTKIWDALTGKEIKTFNYNHGGNFVAFSPDGKLLAGGNIDNTIKIWDIHTGKEIKTLSGHSSWVQSVAFNVNGNLLASGSNDHSIKIWDIHTGKEIKTLKKHQNSVKYITFSPDGKFLASGSWDNTIKIWDVHTWKNIKDFKGHDKGVQTLAFSVDGNLLASGSTDKSIKIWRNLIGRTKKQIQVTGETGEVIGVLPENTIIEFSSINNEIYRPLKGKINIKEIESLYSNIEGYMLYTLNNTSVYGDINKTNILLNIPKARIIKDLYYSKELDLFYIEEDGLRGWIEPSNISYLEKSNTKLAVLNNNTSTFDSIGGARRNTYSSGDVINIQAYDDIEEYYYLADGTWIGKDKVITMDESRNTNRIFANKKEVRFNYDFTGDNFKNIPIGTEFKLLGIAGEHYLLESTSTKEKGWVLASDMSLIKPDLHEPVIFITNTSIENNMLSIKGKVYDDTEIEELLLNGNNISINKLNKFDKIQYIPEVGYSFKSQWFLVEGMENNIELKVVDREGKTYARTLSYTPQLKEVNLNEFKLENIVVKELPQLEYSIELKDENNDGILTGSEKMILTVTVKNVGKGPAQNVNLNIKNPSNNQVSFRSTYPLGTIRANESKVAVIEFTGKDNLTKDRANFELVVEEQNGFNPFPANFSFSVEPKSIPNLKIIDYAIDDENKNGQIEQGERFDIYVLIQNVGEGDARDVIFDISRGAEGIINMSESTFKFDTLKSGESQKVKASFVTNFRYQGDGSLPFTMNLYEERANDKIEQELNLAMNKAVPTIREVNLEAQRTERTIEVAKGISIISDVDTFIDKFTSVKEDSKKWAIVVGIEDYRRTANVDYARRDALAMKKYFNKLMGVPEHNIFYLENSQATLGEMRMLLQDRLQGRVREGDTVYFYFSGHGIPTNDGDTYLLLHDSDPASPRLTAYKVGDVYRDLGSTKAKNSYLFIDSCFAGGTSRGTEVASLLEGTRPGVLKVNEEALKYDNLMVFNATDTNQLSNSYTEQGYGLFTYYLLKGLSGEADKNIDKKISVEELRDYIERNVSDKSRRLYGESRFQRPTFKGRSDKEILIRF